MSNPMTEKRLEDQISSYLANSPMYCQRSYPKKEDFTPVVKNMCDKDELLHFLQAQTKTWAKLTKEFGNGAIDEVIRVYNSTLENQGMLHILKKGIKIRGTEVRFVAFKDEMAPAGSEPDKLYKANRFAVVRQMHYSTDKTDSANTLDLVIFINGLPIITAELKNEFTDQNYTHSIQQYRRDRNPNNRFLRNCLVHFAVDNNYAFMTTRLKGEGTNFLPFNQDSVNPVIPGDYATAYLWRDIWQADSLLNIIEHFIKSYKVNKTDKEETVFFPRFHQLRAVRKLINYAKAEGAGHNYLIEHSAGSGKTKTMAWLAHQLANTLDDKGNPIYDCIIMVTDRIVLNANMADDVNAFEEVAKTVRDIRKGSYKLAAALDEPNPPRIIVCTVQKFSYALPFLKNKVDRHYAIIVDEAHTALGNESMKDLAEALTSNDKVAFDEDFEDTYEMTLAYMQRMRQRMKHLSFYAFTATPKDRTYILFGRKTTVESTNAMKHSIGNDFYEAHDYYTMKQAIDEGFILDVLENYVTYLTMYEYVKKDHKEDNQCDDEFEKKKSIRLIMEALNEDPYNMMQKARMMVTHFMNHTIHKIGGRAKAMVVTDSRKSAVMFKQYIDDVIKTEYNNSIKTLVAFSGKVEIDGQSYSEDSMNGFGIRDNAIREQFNKPEYRILVVADKFQTGFDQPLLHTMFVDKLMGGIQCIQTLSRLNRCYKDGKIEKTDTMVIDFRNKAEDVQKAFQQYYKRTDLQGKVDLQRLYTLKNKIDEYKVYSPDEVQTVAKAVVSNQLNNVPSILKSIVNNYVLPMSNEDKEKLRKYVDRYVRSYGFLAQVMDFIDTDLEEFYIFCRLLYKYLPYTKETLPMEILEQIDLDKLRQQLTFDGALPLDDEDTTLPITAGKDPTAKNPDEELPLSEILDIINEPFKNFLDGHDKVIRTIVDEIQEDVEIIEAFRAGNSPDILAKLIYEKLMEKAEGNIGKFLDFLKELQDKTPFSKEFVSRMVDHMAKVTASDQALPFDADKLIAQIVKEFENDFSALQKSIRPVPEIVDITLRIVVKETLPKYDGMNEMVKDSLNHIYCGGQMRLVDRRRHFNTILSKYETFLKKLFYLINGFEVRPVVKEHKSASFIDAVMSIPCLSKLHHNHDDQFALFADYYNAVKSWRDGESHESATSSEQELREATHKLVAMYLYVTSQNTIELAEAGVIE
ncbi:MAG: DEAD/DEAH box helicase family protein [Bacteroidales bacterium]|nr:DEAD/DEAH box helicase family protein [Bacteroidales bacterium]